MTKFIILIACLVVVAGQFATNEGQLLDRLSEIVNGQRTGQQQQQSLDDVGRQENPFRRIMSVNVPLFYDMIKNGSSLGINVLSGLVKVDRGNEAERSGLVGRRPLSVRVFGVPVYERGTRVRPLPTESRPSSGGGEEEELPIEPTTI